VAGVKLCAGEKKCRAYGAGGEESGGEEKERLAQSALRPARGKRRTQSSQRRAGNADPSTARRLRGAGAPVGMTLLLDGATWDCEKAQA